MICDDAGDAEKIRNMCISYSETEPVATKVEKERRVRVHVSAPLNNKGQTSTHRITMQRALIRATPHQAVRRAMGWPAWRWRADSGPSSRIKASARGITQARVPLAKSPIVACPSSIQDPIRVYAVLERPEVPANLPADRFTSFSPPNFGRTTLTKDAQTADFHQRRLIFDHHHRS